MNHNALFHRSIAVLLLLCLIAGLLPSAALAAEDNAEATSSNIQEEKPATRTIPTTTSLISQINSLKIPSVTQVNNWDTLDGLYFMAVSGRTFNHQSRVQSIGYLNISNTGTALAPKWGYSSVPISVSGGRVKISGAEPDLTHSVTITHNTYEIPDTLSSTLNKQVKAELAAQVSNSTNANFNNKYMYNLMNVYEYTTINVDLNKYTYNIRFNNGLYLNFNVYENMSLSSSQFPILLHPSKSTNYVKIYKTNHKGENNASGDLVDSSYWIGVDTYGGGNVSPAYVMTAATGNQLRRNNFGGRKTGPIIRAHLSLIGRSTKLLHKL